MIATTIEQSKALLAAGFGPETADMCYQAYQWETDGEGNIKPGSVEPVGQLTVGNAFQDFPAWSLGALWDIFNQAGLMFLYDTSEHTSEELVESMVIRLVALKNTDSI